MFASVQTRSMSQHDNLLSVRGNGPRPLKLQEIGLVFANVHRSTITLWISCCFLLSFFGNVSLLRVVVPVSSAGVLRTFCCSYFIGYATVAFSIVLFCFHCY